MNIQFTLANVYVAVVDQNGAVLTGGVLDRPGESQGDGTSSFTINNFVTGNTLTVNGTYQGLGLPGASFTDVTGYVASGKTVKIDGPTGNVILPVLSTPGQTQVLVVFQTATLLVTAVNQSGTPLTAPPFPVNGEVTVTGNQIGGTGTPALAPIPHFAIGRSFEVKGSYNGAGFTTPLTVTPQLGKTIRVNGATGAQIDVVASESAGHSAGETRVDVVFTVVNLVIEAVDQTGTALAGGHVETSGNWTVSGNPTASISGFPSGSSLNVKGSYNGVGSASFTPVTPQADKTIWVNGLTGAVESTTDTPGQNRVNIRFSVVNLVVEAVNQNGTALSTANGFPVNGQVTVSGNVTGTGTPTFSVNGFSLGISFDVKGSYNGAGFTTPLTVTPQLGKTVRVNGVTGAVESTTDTPGQTRIWVVFTVVNLVIEAVDHTGTALSTANGFSTNGHVEIPGNLTGGDPTLPVAGFAIGAPLSVKGSYAGQGAANFTPVTVQANTTVQVNGITGVVLSTAASAGQTRVQIVFAAILVTIKTVDQNGANLKGDIDVPGDPAGPSPFLLPVVVGQALGVNGTYQGLGLPNATFVDITSQVGADKTVKIDGPTGAITSVTSTPGKTEVLVVFSTTTLIVSAVDQAGVPLNVNGLIGHVTLAGGINSEGTPSLTISPFAIGAPFSVSSSFNGVGFVGQTNVSPQMGKTIRLDGRNGNLIETVPSENAGHSAGETRVDIVFTVADFTIKTVDQNDQPLPGSIEILSTSAVGSKTILSYVLGKKNAGDPVSLIARMQGNGAGSGFSGVAFQTGNVDALFKPGHTLKVDALTGQVLSDVANLPGNQAVLNVVYEVIPLTLRTTRVTGEHIPGRIDVPGPPLEPSPFVTTGIVGSTIGVRGEYLGGSSGAFVNVLVVKGRRTHLIVHRPEPGFFEPSTDLPAEVETLTLDNQGVNEIWVQFETVDVIVQALNKAATPLAPMPNGKVNIEETQLGYLPSPHTYNALVEGRFKVAGKSEPDLSKGMPPVIGFTVVTVKKGKVITVDETVSPATVSSPVPTGDGTSRIDILLQTNQKPAFTPTASQAVDEGQPLTFAVSATDPDNDQVTVTMDASGLPAGHNATFSNGTFTWTPTYSDGRATPYVVTFTATDNGSPVLSVSQTVSITVNNVNRAPALAIDPNGNAADGSFTVNEGGPALAFTVSGTDPDAGDVVTVVATGLPTGATFTGGTFSWTPGFTQAGSYTVTFTATDNGSPAKSATKTVTITVNNVNRQPTANAGPDQTVNEGAPVTLSGSGTDPDAGDVLGFQWTQTSGTSVTLTGANTASPTFTAPQVTADETLKFKLVATDNGVPPLSSAPVTVSIIVRNVGAPPNWMFVGVHSGAPTIQKGLRNEDIVKFSRDLQGNAVASTIEQWFDGSLFFKGDEQLDAAAVIDYDGDGSLDLIFSVRSKANLKVGGLEMLPGDLVLYDRARNTFSKFLEGSRILKSYHGNREKADKDRRDDEYKECRDSRENIDGAALRRVGSAWKLFLTMTKDAKFEAFKFDQNDVVQFDYNATTKKISNPVKILDANSLFKGKEANIDALDVLDDDGNGTLESIVFSTSTKEKLKDGREIRASVLYAYHREANTTEEIFDPKEDGLSKTEVNIENVSLIGPIKPWGTGPKPEPAAKPKKGHALLAKVGEEVPEALPTAFGMDQNYPNPFNPSTTIRYALPEAANVTLVIYNVLGQQVRTLVNAPQAAGYHTIVWDGRDEVGRTTATGMYIYRFQAGAFVQTRKMLFAK